MTWWRVRIQRHGHIWTCLWPYMDMSMSLAMAIYGHARWHVHYITADFAHQSGLWFHVDVDSMDSGKRESTLDPGKLEFVVAPPQDRFCPVCTELLTEPLLSDCGHHVCRECHERIMASDHAECPTCQELDVLKTARLNKRLQREVYDLKVHCQNKTGTKRGCQWFGELRELEDHLNPAKKSCEYLPVACTFGCGQQVRLSAMKDHNRRRCPKRLEKCKHCDYYNSRDFLIDNHLPVCPEFPVGCPNKCREKGLKRRQLQSHLDECPLQVIDCPFSSEGCPVKKLPRNQMEIHEDTAMRKHLRLVAAHMSSKRQGSTPQLTVVCPQHLYNIAPIEFTMVDFNQKKQADMVWTSPSFYSRARGYKFCLEAYPNGDQSGTGTHVSVHARRLEGEHDDKLERPFQGKITVHLLDKSDPNSFLSKILTLKEHTDRSACTDFVSHSILLFNKYLLDDSLHLRVAAVAQSVSICKCTGFSRLKCSNAKYNSPPFYTHPQGYKLCLLVLANGYGTGEGTHVSIFTSLMRGEHDQHLPWPFRGELTIELLNWREDESHYAMTLPITADCGFVRVTDRQYGTPYGWHQFISHSSLFYNPTTNTEYVRDDCLQLRVSVAHS